MSKGRFACAVRISGPRLIGLEEDSAYKTHVCADTGSEKMLRSLRVVRLQETCEVAVGIRHSSSAESRCVLVAPPPGKFDPSGKTQLK